MRPFGETLPTMSDTAGLPGEPAGAGTAGTAAGADFGPNAILKALKARSAAPVRGAPDRGEGRTAARHTAFDPAQLPRKTATGLARTPFARKLAAAIEPFDAPEPKDPPAETAAETAQPEPDPSERERIVEEVRAEERRSAEETLASERERWLEEIAEQFSAQLDKAFVDLHNRLADAITEALTPVLEEAMRARAIARFSAGLERLAGRAEGSTAAPITVRGPQVLLNALSAARSGDTAGLKLVAADECELVASVNETTLRTTIKAWATTLAAAGSRHGKE